MSEVTQVIVAQTKMMELDLTIIVQKMKIKELDARAHTLNARSQMEQFRLNRMIEIRKTLKDK